MNGNVSFLLYYFHQMHLHHDQIMLTGSILKPSDQRIKTNITPVSTSSQLEKIMQLKIYDYELKHGKEAGTTGDKERGCMYWRGKRGEGRECDEKESPRSVKDTNNAFFLLLL